jgi:hypothetical protein
MRELDGRLSMGALIERYLTDTRRGRNTQFPLADLLGQSVYSRLAGYEDVNDAERVSADPTFRLIGSEKIWGRGAALTSRLHAFETELLAEEAEEDRPLVADQRAAAVGRDWRARGETCPVLLAPAGRGASDEASVRSDSAEDLGATAASGIAKRQERTRSKE